MIENLFDTLCASFQLRENQRIFLKSEGIELMLIMLKYVRKVSYLYNSNFLLDKNFSVENQH